MSKDHWSSAAYTSAAAFVPKLTTKVISYLDAQPSDRILDIGCGDGVLTQQIAHKTSSGQVFGLDASHSFIATARENYSATNCTYEYQDCTDLAANPVAVDGSWDKVFSNAAMHWILREESTRETFFRNIHAALKVGGKFVFEMGGKGNVAEVQAAATAALLHAGLSLEEAREASPWFFPSEKWMRMMLEEVGFVVEVCEHEYRMTQFTADDQGDGRGGLEGWVRLMCSQFGDAVGEEKREEVFREICDVVEPIVSRPEDGSKWIGYARLRAVARKK